MYVLSYMYHSVVLSSVFITNAIDFLESDVSEMACHTPTEMSYTAHSTSTCKRFTINTATLNKSYGTNTQAVPVRDLVVQKDI